MSFTSKRIECPDCGASRGVAVHADGWGHCHACPAEHRHKSADRLAMVDQGVKDKSPPRAPQDGSAAKQAGAVLSRGILSPTAAKYGLLERNGSHGFVYKTEGGEQVATKWRDHQKNFRISGDIKQAGLFGQHLWPGGGKYVTITEGEFDAMASWQMGGGDYATVSLKNGASSALKDCKAAYKWLDSFEKIVLSFDADEPGQRAAAEIAKLFPGKALVIKHAEGFKDACDYCSAGEGALYKKRWWEAERYIPSEIICGQDMWEEVNQPRRPPLVKYPWECMNKLARGIRPGELVMFTAGTGLGKSQVVREIAYHVLTTTDLKVGALFLEDNRGLTGLSIMSLHAGKRLHLDDTESTEEERRAAFDATIGQKDRWFMLRAFGSNDVDEVVGHVRTMAKALDCQVIILDHISIVVSSQDNDERKALDEIMTKLRMLCEETNVALLGVCHLKRAEKGAHEEGGATSLSQLRGSGGIAQLSDIVIGLERNQQADDMDERNTTRVRVLKNRFSGETGPAGDLYYNPATGRMIEIDLEGAL